MRAMVITAVGKAEIREIEKPKLIAGHLLVRMLSCAVCTHDQRVFTGVTHPQLPFLGGHEGVGEVVEVGEGVTGFEVGDHVVDSRGCGTCWYCRHGLQSQCMNADFPAYASRLPKGDYFVNNGEFAEYILVAAQRMMPVAKSVPLKYACLSEPISDVLHSVNTGDPAIADTVVVIGGGIMGQLHCQLARLRGARVILLEIDEERRKLAESIGSVITIDPSTFDAVERVRELTCGQGADVVFNATAVASVWDMAIKLVRRQGKVIGYSALHPKLPVPLPLSDLHTFGYQVIGVYNSTAREVQSAVKLLEYGMLDMDPLIAAVMPMSDPQAVMEAATAKGKFRIVMDMTK